MTFAAILPHGAISLIAVIAVLSLLWYGVRFLPEPVARLKWACYLIIILVMAYYIWTRWV